MAKAARSRSRAWENTATMTMAAVTPMTVAIRRKQAFSRARPRVGSARIATVTAAADGTSSSSQKLAAKATTTANQIRIPKAQEPAGTPASRNGRSIAMVVIGGRALTPNACVVEESAFHAGSENGGWVD